VTDQSLNRLALYLSSCFLYVFAGLLLIMDSTVHAAVVHNDNFLMDFSDSGLVSLKRQGDPCAIEFIMPGKSLGVVDISWRFGQEEWHKWRPDQFIKRVDSNCGEYSSVDAQALSLIERFKLNNGSLIWTIELANVADKPLEVGDLALPLLMNTKYPKDQPAETFERRLFRHSYISGNGSFVFWMPVGGVGMHLVMIPQGPTHLEYFEDTSLDYAAGGGEYRVFIHSAVSGGLKKQGTWRQPNTSLKLSPGQKAVYSFRFFWADDYNSIREVLYSNGGFDIRVIPGMVIPEDLQAMFSLRTKNAIEGIEPEFPNETTIENMGEKQQGTHVYRVKFTRLGENLLTVRYNNGQYMVLEFFVTQSLETLITKRADFIAHKQQHRDPSKWYNGLFSLWDVRLEKGKNLLGPDNTGKQDRYAVSGSDDPSNSKCIYLSEKNVAYPRADEIEALEYFISNFVWGKHQRTDEEYPYPCGIYGSDNWYENRFSKRDLLENGVSRPGGPSQCRMWRTFDYTTYFALYYNMYRIASQNPQLVHYLDADGYLKRAYLTAKAYFEVPAHIRMEGGWAFTGWVDWQYTLGNFHEKYLLGIIDALEQKGLKDKANYLRKEWEKKVKYFLYDDPYPFVSEMPVDSTAYESSYAIAKYALTHKLETDIALWQNRNTGRWYSHPQINPLVHKAFLKRQLLANLACRGWLETSYYHLGSDFRALGSSGYCLSYMSQMGGWAILDYGLYFADVPTDYIQLGYASMLSSWALVNAGTKENNYGFWYPGEFQDGAVGWGFMPQKLGNEWNPATHPIPRGVWPVCGEIDHGLTAGIEAASTVVYDDPIFGLVACGGILQINDDVVSVDPRDGVRQRFHARLNGKHLRILLDRDGFAKNQPIVFDEQMSKIEFALENRASIDHSTVVKILGLPADDYVITVNGMKMGSVQVRENEETVLPVEIEAKTAIIKLSLLKGIE
jgi:hypothetical protein